MSEQYQEDPAIKKPLRVKHSFKKAFSRHSQTSGSSLTASSGSGSSSSSPINPASVLLDELIGSLTSLYMNTKKQFSSKQIIRCLDDFIDRIPDTGAIDERGEVSWATVFHGRLDITKKPLNFEQFGVLNNAISLYVRENSAGVQKRLLFQQFERYLSTHKVDPENSFVGVYVSEDFRDLPVAESNTGVTAGAMVLARIERGGECVRVGLGDSVLCRVCREPAHPGDDDCPVLVSFDPEEKCTEEVPLGVLTVLTHAHEAALVAAQSGDFGALADPAQNIFRYFCDEELAPNIVIVAMNGLEEVLKPEKTEALLHGNNNGVWDIKGLEYVVKFFKMDITDQEIMENYACDLSSKWDEYRTGLLSEVDAHNVSFHVLVNEANIAALRNFDLCGIIRKALAAKAAEVEKVVTDLKASRDAIISGESKQAMTSEYLAAVKKGVMGFLTTRGYDFDLIPQEYIEKPPADKDRVVTNLGICREAARDTELQQIIKIICNAAYVKIDAWVSNAVAVLVKKFEIGDASPSDIQSAFAKVKAKVETLAKDKADSKSVKKYLKLLDDVEYFTSMKRTDDAINSGAIKPGETPEYVMSIHAAAKSRLKLIEEECMTVVEIWCTPEQKRRAVDVGTEREIKRVPESELKLVRNVYSDPNTVVDMNLPPCAVKTLARKAPE